MWFKDAEHEKSFAELREKAGARPGEREYLAALYVLAALDKPVAKYVQPRRVAFTALFKAAGPWSTGKRHLSVWRPPCSTARPGRWRCTTFSTAWTRPTARRPWRP